MSPLNCNTMDIDPSSPTSSSDAPVILTHQDVLQRMRDVATFLIGKGQPEDSKVIRRLMNADCHHVTILAFAIRMNGNSFNSMLGTLHRGVALSEEDRENLKLTLNAVSTWAHNQQL